MSLGEVQTYALLKASSIDAFVSNLNHILLMSSVPNPILSKVLCDFVPKLSYLANKSLKSLSTDSQPCHRASLACFSGDRSCSESSSSVSLITVYKALTSLDSSA